MNYIVTSEELTSIADELRERRGKSDDLVFPDGFLDFIRDMAPDTDENIITRSVKHAWKVKTARAYVNNSDSTDQTTGAPGKSVAVVIVGGDADSVAQAIYDKMIPGYTTFGTTTGNATDKFGNIYPMDFTRYSDVIAFVYVYMDYLGGVEKSSIETATAKAVFDYTETIDIAEPLIIDNLYEVIEKADPLYPSHSFTITDIYAQKMSSATIVRDRIETTWKQKIKTIEDGGIAVRWNE